MGNAAIAGIEHVNEVEAKKQAIAKLKSATITPYPAMQVDDIPQTIAPVSTVPDSYIAQDATVAGTAPDPALTPAVATTSNPAPANIQTLPEIVVTPDYSYERASAQDEALYAYNSGLEAQSFQDDRDLARVNASRLADQQNTQLIAARASAMEHAQFAEMGQAILGTGELIYGGIRNQLASMVGGLASIPYLADSADAAVSVQQWYQAKLGYTPDSIGAQEVASILQPVGQAIQSDVVEPAHDFSEAHIGDAGTTILFATAQAGIQVGGLLDGAGEVSALGTTAVRDATGLDAFALDATENASTHPLQGWTPQQVVDYANSLGVQTDRDSLILWSGLGPGDEGIVRSQAWANEFGGTTLEMTPGGSWLNSMDVGGEGSPFTRAEAIQIWDEVSRSAVQQATGQVRVTLGWVQENSTYLRVEVPALQANPNITSVDPIYLKSKYGILTEH